MNADQFWSCTMDEIELMIKGSVDRWRIERRFAYMQTIAHGTMKNPPTITELFPLPYDHELEDKLSQDEAIEFYKQYEGLL